MGCTAQEGRQMQEATKELGPCFYYEPTVADAAARYQHLGHHDPFGVDAIAADLTEERAMHNQVRPTLARVLRFA